MATQSLYRRYRPRRFSEVRGQDHVVKALRTSVAEGREGQAYLFSGPRGTGKTTSARILAKVLNCTNPQDGEPCCECESCLSVERGTSYDVHELDAASNNGVDSMRDLIDKASLGTPGRHKVYILDEVHMLTKPAEAALLKTLEEPPPHVVFVLATTDPQKMSDTIRSRTQHLQFHLLPADTLHDHVRWVAEDAGLAVSDAAIEQVLTQGGGSARDTLSALELVANTGGDGAETVPVEDFVEAMIDRDPGRALTMVASAIGLGRDPRTLTEELIGFLRNGFLSLMAPDLVQLPSARVAGLSEQAQRLGAAGLVRGIEQLGQALTEMRHAPDPRVLLDVAIVKLTSDDAASADAGAAVGALTARIVKLEQQLAAGTPVGATVVASATAMATPTATPAAVDAEAERAPRDPSTGRAALGGRARRAAPGVSDAAPAVSDAAPAVSDAASAVSEPASATTEPVSVSTAESGAPAVATTSADAVPAAQASQEPPTKVEAASDSVDPVSSRPSELSKSLWDDTVKPALRGMTRAVYSPSAYVSNSDTVLTLSLPNPVHRDKCEQHRSAVEQALSEAAGGTVTLELVVGGGSSGSGGSATSGPGGGAAAVSRGAQSSAPAPAQSSAQRSEPVDPSHPAADPHADESAADFSEAAARGIPEPAESPRRAAERKLAEAAASGIDPDPDSIELEVTGSDLHVLPEDHEVDVHDLVDAPPETVKTPIDRLAEAFPGSELVDESY